MDGATSESDWGMSAYGLVYAKLMESLDGWTRTVAPGTAATLGRAVDHFRQARDPERVAQLERLSVLAARLQQEARLSGEADVGPVRHALREGARLWLEQAPMSPDAFPAASRIAA